MRQATLLIYCALWVALCVAGGIIGSDLSRDGAILGVGWGTVLFALLAIIINRFAARWADGVRELRGGCKRFLGKVNSPEGMRAAFLVLVAALVLIALCLVVIACVLVF